MASTSPNCHAHALRSPLSIILQDPVLFSGTIPVSPYPTARPTPAPGPAPLLRSGQREEGMARPGATLLHSGMKGLALVL